ncbi:MAG: protein adenylyltransferase SelO [Betaproteobacteria bacterium]
MEKMGISFDNSYARDLPGFYVACAPAPAPAARLIYFNQGLADELGLDLAACDPSALADLFSGNRLPEGALPISQAYAGHQFGHFVPQLGDGRALLIGEVLDRQGKRRDIAFKGSGRTPFSRRGDGKAALGPMLREVLIGEAMHALRIPTTRALAVVGTGEPVYRETVLPGAILTRVAASHLRVGTFEFFAARGEQERVRQLVDYAVARHYPELLEAEERPLEFLRAVARRQAALVAQWMGVGFIHGVMNTDNMSIAGETIDYGPCAFMEAYDPAAVFSSIDERGRYAYGNQPAIAQWNLARLAETLLPLLAEDESQAIARASEVVEEFPRLYQRHWLQGMRAKLGLAATAADGEESDTALVEGWLALLELNQVDFTLAWSRLADAAEGDSAPLRKLFCNHAKLDAWLGGWRARCAAEDGGSEELGEASCARARRMRAVNPWIIPRNHRVEEALAAASDDGNLEPFEQLLHALDRPFEEQPGLAHYAEPAPAAFTGSYRTFCGT